MACMFSLSVGIVVSTFAETLTLLAYAVFLSVLQSRPLPKTVTLLAYFSVSVGIAVLTFAKIVTWLSCCFSVGIVVSTFAKTVTLFAYEVFQSVLQSRPPPKQLHYLHIQFFGRYCSVDLCKNSCFVCIFGAV